MSTPAAEAPRGARLKRSTPPKKIGQCAYCGERRPLTDDHIPPKNFFPKPRAYNLITVPCCESCHAGLSKDDEYFRNAALCSARVSEEKMAQKVVDSFFRSLNRSEHKRLARRMLNSIEEVGIETEAGLYLGKQPALKLEQERIARVGQRIIRGLFFHEKLYALPKGYDVKACFQQCGIDHILGKLGDVCFPKLRVIQDGIFCYTFKETGEDPNSTLWLALFYAKFPFVGFTWRPPESRAVIRS